MIPVPWPFTKTMSFGGTAVIWDHQLTWADFYAEWGPYIGKIWMTVK